LVSGFALGTPEAIVVAEPVLLSTVTLRDPDEVKLVAVEVVHNVPPLPLTVILPEAPKAIVRALLLELLKRPHVSLKLARFNVPLVSVTVLVAPTVTSLPSTHVNPTPVKFKFEFNVTPAVVIVPPAVRKLIAKLLVGMLQATNDVKVKLPPLTLNVFVPLDKNVTKPELAVTVKLAQFTKPLMVTVYVPLGKTTSSPVPGAPDGDQFPAVVQLPVTPVQVFVATVYVSWNTPFVASSVTVTVSPAATA